MSRHIDGASQRWLAPFAFSGTGGPRTPGVLAGVLGETGVPAAPPDASLGAEAQARVAAAQSLMARLGLHGVPALLRGAEQPPPNGLLYGPRDALLAAVA